MHQAPDGVAGLAETVDKLIDPDLSPFEAVRGGVAIVATEKTVAELRADGRHVHRSVGGNFHHGFTQRGGEDPADIEEHGFDRFIGGHPPSVAHPDELGPNAG